MLAGLENEFILSLFVIGLMRRGFDWLCQPILLCAARLGCSLRIRAVPEPRLGIPLQNTGRADPSVAGALSEICTSSDPSEIPAAEVMARFSGKGRARIRGTGRLIYPPILMPDDPGRKEFAAVGLDSR